jgi:hypothetical protein
MQSLLAVAEVEYLVLVAEAEALLGVGLSLNQVASLVQVVLIMVGVDTAVMDT